MKSLDLVTMARGNLKRKRMRTFLTVLGIVIGTVSIILMVAIGIGLKNSVMQEFSTMGSLDVVEVYKGSNRNRQVRMSEIKEDSKLQELDLEFIKSIENVTDVAPLVYSNVKLISGVYEATSTVVGIKAEQMEKFGFALEEGQLLDDNPYGMVMGGWAVNNFYKVSGKGYANNRDVMIDYYYEDDMDFGFASSSNKVAPKVDVFSDRIKLTLDTGYSIQGGNQESKAAIYPVKGVGILKKGTSNRDDKIFMDYDQVLRMNKEQSDIYNVKVREGFDQAYVKVSDSKLVEPVIKALEAKGYQTFSMASMLESINSSLAVVQIALGAIGGISLIVAAIGITNTMVMAISERRKEIGVMKVIGATIKDIKRLFLIEAAMIGGLGGFIGIAICVVLTEIISSPWFGALLTGGGDNGPTLDFTLPLWLVASGLGFTTMVGILSGYLPARKAMRSSALQALRTE